ncbi:MAG: TRAP transporter small permease subunit [Desulfobacterales bacterium]
MLGGDDLIRHLVLWIAFIGAGIATRSRSHVKIDVITTSSAVRKKYLDVVRLFQQCAPF